MSGRRESWLLNVARGAAGGLLAGWFMEKAQARIWKLGSRATLEREKAIRAEPATYKLAEIAVGPFGIRLSPQQKAKGGRIVHYAYGAAWGGVFALLVRRIRWSPLAAGTLFGALLWLASDEILVPLLGFAKGPRAYPASVHLKGLASHLVYGATAAGAQKAFAKLPGLT